MATVTGWGTNYYGGSTSNKLMEVKVYVITNEQCKKNYAYNSYQITSAMLCAIVPGGGGASLDLPPPIF